jgi:hypothetical protein
MAPQSWPRPSEGHLGARSSAATITGTVAPLLAGFSITMAAVVVADNDKLRWPGAAALLATLAAIAMVTAIQLGAKAQAHDVSPAHYVDWFDDTVDERRVYVDEMRREHTLYGISAGRARRAFNIGVTLIYAGLTSALVPQDGDAQPLLRLAAAGCALVAALVEGASGLLTELRARRRNHAGF